MLVGIGAAWALMMSVARLREVRLMQDLPTSKIRSAAQGYVELAGRARPGIKGSFRCPVGGLECLWWDYEIQKKQWFDNDMETVASDTTTESFYLEDDTGRCIVNPHGARIIPSVSYVWYGFEPYPRRVPGRVQRVLSRLFAGSMLNPISFIGYFMTFGLLYIWSMTFGRYRYDLRLIRPDEPLYALGMFRTQRAADSGHFDEAGELRKLLAEWKQDQQKLRARFDMNSDGKLDVKEWEAARRVALQQVRRAKLEHAVSVTRESSAARALHVLGPSDVATQPYLLSTKDQTQLGRRHRWHTLAYFLVFLVLGLLFTLLLVEGSA